MSDTADKTKKWNRDGNLIYSLTHAGWKRGKELMTNDITISIQSYSSESKKEAEEITALIYNLLNNK